MAAKRNRVLSVDRKAAKEAVIEISRRAGQVAALKARAGARAAKEKLGETGAKSAKTLVGRARKARRYVETQASSGKDAALESAVQVCVDLTSKQLAVLQKLQSTIAKR